MISAYIGRQANHGTLTVLSFFLTVLFGAAVYFTFHSDYGSVLFYIGLVAMTLILSIWLTPAAIAFGILVWIVRTVANS